MHSFRQTSKSTPFYQDSSKKKTEKIDGDICKLHSGILNCRSLLIRSSSIEARPLIAAFVVGFSLVGDLACGRSTSVQNQQDDGQGGTSNNTLSLGRVSAAVLANLKTDISGESVDLLSTKLVVDQTTKGDGVAEELLGSDRVTEDHHRGAHQKDILQDSSHCENNSGGLANLGGS